jgi:hypothetical protein
LSQTPFICENVAMCGQEDRDLQQAGLVAAGLGQQLVDGPEDLRGLTRDILLGIGGDLAGEVDDTVVDRDFGHARSDVKTLDGHGKDSRPFQSGPGY